MSGVEAVAAVSLGSNIVQFIDFGSKLCARINELAAGAGAAPGQLQKIQDRLSQTLAILRGLDEESRKSVENDRNILEACTKQVQDLEELIKTFIVEDDKPGSSHRQRGAKKVEKVWKALKSLQAEERIESCQQNLDRLLSLVQLQLQARTDRKVDRHSAKILEKLDNLHLEQASKPSVVHQAYAPVTVLPFTRNPRFIGRTHLLEQIDRIFQSGQRVIALCGLGGVGKSQIALEYSYRFKEASPDASIFWIYTSTGVNFEQAYSRVAASCGIPKSDDTGRNSLQIIKDWLEDYYPLKWLMIIDNVDSVETFFQKDLHGKPLVEYVPDSPNGFVLYTSRNRDIGVDLMHAEPIMIPSLNLDEAQLLIGRKLTSQSSHEDQLALLEELDYLPLAINQAVAYMTKRRKLIPEYLQIFRQSDSNRVHLLKHEFADHGRQDRRRESLAMTFMVSFDYIRTEHPKVAELLSIMSFYDRQGIRQSLLLHDESNRLQFQDSMGLLIAFSFVTDNFSRSADSTAESPASSPDHGEDTEERADNSMELSEAEDFELEGSKLDDSELDDTELGDSELEDLTDSSMMGVADNARSYNMHRLVQLATRAWLHENAANGGEKFAAEALQRLSQDVYKILDPYDSELDYTIRILPILPHCEALLAFDFSNKTEAVRLAQASLHHARAWGAFMNLKWSAEAEAAKSLAIREEILGPGSVEACRSMVLVAWSLLDHLEERPLNHQWTKIYEEAAGFLQRALEGFYSNLRDAAQYIFPCVRSYIVLLLYKGEEIESQAAELFQGVLGITEYSPHGMNEIYLQILSYLNAIPLIYSPYESGQLGFRDKVARKLWLRCMELFAQKFPNAETKSLVERVRAQAEANDRSEENKGYSPD